MNKLFLFSFLVFLIGFNLGFVSSQSSVCGNNLCEDGEDNIVGGCGSNADPRCIGPPGRTGNCPQDCSSGLGNSNGVECDQSSDCKLIYGPCSCDSVSVSDLRVALDEGSIVCVLNSCTAPKVVAAVCERNKCVRSDEVKTFKLSNGRNVEIKVLPETASARAVERLGELGFAIELKEVGFGENAKVAYELSAKKEAKIFGFIKKQADVKVYVDAESGDVISVKRPWWSFLARGI